MARNEAGDPKVLTLQSGSARAVLSTWGAHLMSYIPSPDIGEVIWTGGYEAGPGCDCWGGVPLVWPWFMLGSEAEVCTPFHGVARHLCWEVLAGETGPSGESVVVLGLQNPSNPVDGTPVGIDAELVVRLSDKLRMELGTRNSGEGSRRIEHCFHAYFRVGDVRQVRVEGLDGAEVQDNRAEGSPRSTQAGPVVVDGPAARIYRPFPQSVAIEDAALGRRITIQTEGARQLVLWNSGPPREECGRLTGEAEWMTQLAVEPLCGLEETLTLAPGAGASLAMEISAEPIG